ncbi:MAG: hypothetical protein AAF320_04070 [Myxococcota bacterium]
MKRFGWIVCLWACLLTTQAAYAQQALEKVSSLIRSMPRKALQQVNQYLNGRLEVASTHFTFPSSLTLHDVQLKDSEEGLLASAQSVHMQLTLSALLKGRLVVSKMVISQPMFYLNHTEGKLNWKSLFRTQDAFGKNRSTFIRIDDITIQNGRFFFENPKQEVEVLCESVQADGSVEINGTKAIINVSSVHSHRGTINAKHLQFPYHNLQADSLSVQNKILHIHQATSDIMGLHARAQGGIDFNTKRYNIHAWLDVPPATWLIGLSPLPFTLPSFHATGTLTGKLKDPIVQARAEFSQCKPYNITVQQGWLTTHVTRRQVRIDDGLIQLEGGGSIKPQGWVRYTDKSLLFQAQLENVRVANLVRAGHSNMSLDGFMKGNLRVTGIANGEKPINFTFQGGGKQLQILGRFLAPQTQTYLNLDLLNNTHLRIHQASLQAPGMHSRIEGILRNQGFSSLRVSGTAKNLNLLLQDLPDFIKGRNLRFRFHVRARKKQINIRRGRMHIGKLHLWKSPLQNVSLVIKGKGSQGAQIDVQKGDFASGQVNGNLEIQQFTSTSPITGSFKATGISLLTLHKILPHWAKLTGTMNAQLTVSGSFAHPQASFRLQGQEIAVYKIPFGKLTGHGNITPLELNVSHLTTNNIAAAMTIRQFRMLWRTKQLKGDADVHIIKLGNFLSSFNPQLEGHLQSKIKLGGTWKKPQLQSQVKIENLYWKQIPLGAGNVYLWFKDAHTQSDNTTQTLLQISGKLKRGGQHIFARSSLLLPGKKLHLHLGATGLSIQPWSQMLPHLAPLSGRLQLDLSAWGNWHSPQISANVTIPQLHVKEPTIFSQHANPVWYSVGSLHSHFSLKSGQLQGFLCALRQGEHKTHQNSCLLTDPLQAQFHGTVHPSGVFNIRTTGHLTDVSAGQFLQRLQAQSINVTTSLYFDLTTMRPAGSSGLTTNGYLDIQKFRTTATGLSEMQLQKPVKLRLKNNRLQSTSPIGFTWDNRETWLQGWIEPKRLDLQLQGALPLPLTTSFLPQKASVSGNLTGKLRIWGLWASPLWQGTLFTDTQVLARVGGIHDTIRWHKGEFLLQPSHHHPGCTHVQAQHISLDIGSGHLKLNGETDVCPLQKRTQSWNASAQIEDLLVKWERNWLELNGDLAIITQKGSNQITGDINVSTGLLTRRFSWQDFVLTAKTSQNGWKQPSLDWLSPLHVDVHLLAPSLSVWADIAVARIRGSIASDLRLKTAGKELFLEGGVEILEGTVQFPAIDFTIQQDTILLSRLPGSFIHAHIDLNANSSELPQDQSALGTPVTLKLNLAGNWNRMRAKLQSFPRDSKSDPSRMLAILVSPAGTSSLGALLALSSQVAFQPAVGEFEEWFFDSTQSRLRVSSTTQASGAGPRVQWEVDEHVELEAAASFGTSSSVLNNQVLNNLRLRILLFDHLPVGNSLFLEGAALVPYERGSDTRLDQRLRLVYRILEQ